MDRIVPPLSDIRASDVAAYRVAELSSDDIEGWEEDEASEPWWIGALIILGALAMVLIYSLLGLAYTPAKQDVALSTRTEIVRGVGPAAGWKPVDVR